jgi:hypothetical protein
LADDDEAKRTHDEGCRPQPERRDAEWQGNGPGDDPSCKQIDVERRTEMDRHESGGIGADTEERCLSKRQQSGIADEQIEAVGRQQEDQRDDDGMKRIITEEQWRETCGSRQHDAKGDAEIAAWCR